MSYLDVLSGAVRDLFWGKRSLSRPKIADFTADHIRGSQIDNLHVMISSPLHSLERVRELLHLWLTLLPAIKVEEFEHATSEGDNPEYQSVRMVDRAAIVILLFGDQVGSPSPDGGPTFSEIEFRALKARQAATGSCGRPRVYAYKHTTRELVDWEREAADDFGVRPILDEAKLATQIFIDVSAALILERQAHAAALYPLKEALKVAKSDKADADREHQAALAEMAQRHKEVLAQVQMSFDSDAAELAALRNQLTTREQQDQERMRKVLADRDEAQEALNRARLTNVRRLGYACLIGVVLGVLAPIFWINQLRLSPSNDLSLNAASSGIRAGLDVIAERISTRPEIIEAKVALMNQLVPGFDCAVNDNSDWPIRSIPGAFVSRREICESWGSFVIRIVKPAENCQVSVLSSADLEALSAWLNPRRAKIALIRIVGRSSVDRINTGCPVPKDILPSLNLQASDRLIHENSQLSHARAEFAALQLSKALAIPQSLPGQIQIIIKGSLGVLDRRSPNTGKPDMGDRGIDIEIFAKPNTTGAVSDG